MFGVARRVNFGDCDPSGIAYFPSYLNILNGVVEEFWSSIGLPWSELILNRKIGTPTVHLECEFVRPSTFGDHLTFNLYVRGIGRSSLRLYHEVFGDIGRSWSARQTLVATSTDNHRSIPWPDDVRSALCRHLESDGGLSVGELKEILPR